MAAIHVTIPEDLYELVKQRTGDSQAALDQTVTLALRQALADTPPARMSVEEERQRMREAFGSRILPPDAFADWLEELGGPLTPEEDEEWERDAPVLDPPLTRTLIEMRDEERY